MRFHQQPSKQYVCRKKNKKFAIFWTKYRLHRLEMMSHLMWIPPYFGQVSNLMWIFFQLDRRIVWLMWIL